MARRTKTSSEGEGETEISLRRIIKKLMTIPPERWGEGVELLETINSPETQKVAEALKLYYEAIGVLEEHCKGLESGAGKAN